MMSRNMRRSGTMEVSSCSKTAKHYIEPPPSPIFPISGFFSSFAVPLALRTAHAWERGRGVCCSLTFTYRLYGKREDNTEVTRNKCDSVEKEKR